MPDRLRTITTLALVSVFALVSIVSASSAPAQDQDPARILLDSAETLKSTPGFSAKVTLSGDGSKMILDSLPSMTARMNVGTHSEYGKSLHLLGQLRPTREAPPEAFDIAYTIETYSWTDHPKTTVNIRPPSVSVRQRPRIFTYLLMAELVKDSPFESEISSATAIELQPNESIAGVECYVIYITRSKAKRDKGASAHNFERWFIAVDDKLPRRVEQITDGGMIKATLIMELSGLTIETQTDEDLFVFAPENYRVSDTTRPQAQSQPTTPDIDQPFTKPDQPVAQPAVVTPTDPRAPSYRFSDANTSTVSNSTQSGRITALYFFGSWSIPSKQTTPLFSALADEFNAQSNTPVDCFAIAQRESDPNTLTDVHTSSGYAHRLVINPTGDLSAVFKVRVFPTIVIVDDNNRLIFQQHLTKDRDAQALIDNAKASITNALK